MKQLGIFLIILGIALLLFPVFEARIESAPVKGNATTAIGFVVIAAGLSLSLNTKQRSFFEKKMLDQELYDEELRRLKPFEMELFHTILDFGSLEEADSEIRLMASRANVRTKTVRKVAKRILNITQ